MGVAAVVVVALGVVVGVLAGRSFGAEVAGPALPAGFDPSGPVPAGATANGAIRVGAPNAPVTVRVVADLQCPACKRFEDVNGALLAEVVGSGLAAVEYNIVTFLDRASVDKYSSRAGNASYCVAAHGTSNYQRWLEAMFEQQPAEGGSSFSDDALIAVAEQAGYRDPAVAQCITARTHDAYLRARTAEILAGDVQGTPTVFINGVKADNRAVATEAGLRAAIESAR
ncbi:thioredoxin domain-containing protein [Nocardia sp. 2]|uniref:Thioredoxin domain-containing protein n=1 Tax=Nocardia acididurans TaxID=2802282 RepID=A0ABS1M804_9NOCA|nr:thioredoxin domain-containing protein [Nocardia acididurans]MBL1076431.1 thioredoxin domain-containing protein [Nocardia acididurans]